MLWTSIDAGGVKLYSEYNT